MPATISERIQITSVLPRAHAARVLVGRAPDVNDDLVVLPISIVSCMKVAMAEANITSHVSEPDALVFALCLCKDIHDSCVWKQGVDRGPRPPSTWSLRGRCMPNQSPAVRHRGWQLSFYIASKRGSVISTRRKSWQRLPATASEAVIRHLHWNHLV